MIYIYKHPEKEEFVEVSQGMNDDHVYFDEDDTQWKRVFTKPNMAMDTKLDPYSSSDYVKSTSNKKGTVGDLIDLKKEMASKRAEKDGKDPVTEKYIKNYEKGTGMPFPGKKAENFENKHVKVEFD